MDDTETSNQAVSTISGSPGPVDQELRVWGFHGQTLRARLQQLLPAARALIALDQAATPGPWNWAMYGQNESLLLGRDVKVEGKTKGKASWTSLVYERNDLENDSTRRERTKRDAAAIVAAKSTGVAAAQFVIDLAAAVGL